MISLTDAWFWRALLTGSLVATSCATIGVFLYLRRMSLIADALAHIALPGIVVAFLISGGLNPNALLIGAAALGAAATFGIESITRRGVRGDAAIGIVFTVLFAAGVILLSSQARHVDLDLNCVLFGDILGVSNASIARIAFATAATVLLTAAFWRWLAAATFDPIVAATLGVPVAAVHYGIVLCASLTAVASFDAVGSVLGVAMVIVPAATAHRLADRLAPMLAWAIGHALASTIVGVVVSVAVNCSTSGAIVLAEGFFYAVILMCGPRHSVLSRLRHA